MIIKYISLKKIKIFINSLYIDLDNYNNKNELEEKIKNILVKINKQLKLIGYYKINIYPCKNIGIFMDIIKLEDFSYSLIFNYKINIKDSEIYFKTNDYFNIKDINNIYYYNNNYYCLTSNIKNIYKLIEFGSFIYGEDLFNIYHKFIKI